MGIFGRFSGNPSPAPGAADAPPSGVSPRLITAREKLDEKDVAGAVAIYEEILSESGDRADVLVTISGDLGATGNIAQIIELVAPRYDAERHGPATGINLVQAFLAARDPVSAQHVLDILFALKKPELESRLHGFSNAIAELMTSGSLQGMPAAEGAAPPRVLGMAIVSISKPIWSYGLEAASSILPPKEGKLRRIAFTQFSLPNAYADPIAAMREPEDEIGRYSRAIPLWFAESFYFSPLYSPIAALGCLTDPPKRPGIFSTDWTPENLKQLVETTSGGLDYIFTGSLTKEPDGLCLVMRVWEVRKMRERKQFTVRWTPATADAELARLHGFILSFMEWAPYPEGAGIPYSRPSAPTVWLGTIGAMLGLFLIEKGLMPRDQLAPLSPVFDAFAPHAFSPPASSLAWVSLRMKASSQGLAPALSEVLLSRHPAVAQARAIAGA
ncbi:MAG TPA: hypothetical protein VGG37_03090 [Opitutaceae bacterium]|jgi:hypothetical protein